MNIQNRNLQYNHELGRYKMNTSMHEYPFEYDRQNKDLENELESIDYKPFRVKTAIKKSRNKEKYK